MAERKIIHATLVQLDGKGILLIGKSGSGKSDLALRLIMNKKAQLVADDVVILQREGDKIIGFSPEKIKGLFEVRGVGIVRFPYLEETPINLVVRLVDAPEKIERMPKDAHENILGLAIAQIDLYAKENSAPEKVALKLSGTIMNDALL